MENDGLLYYGQLYTCLVLWYLKKKKNHFKWNVYSLDGYLYQIFFFKKKKPFHITW